MPDNKPPMPPIESRVPTIGELTASHELLAKALAQADNARLYLARILNGEELLPVLHVHPPASKDKCTGAGGTPPQFTDQAIVNMDRLPSEAVELILGILFEHEENMACDLWKNIAFNSAMACKLIEKYKAQKAAAQKQEAEAGVVPDDESLLLPFPTSKKEPLNVPPNRA